MADAPDQSLSQQCDDWADLKAAYRFLHPDNVTPDRIQPAHRQLVRLACAAHPVVLAVQDTAELDYNTQTTAAGLGPIGNGSRQGLLQHSTLAVLPDGRLLGLLHQIWLTIAWKGGWLGRRSDGPPGWITIWRGWNDFLLIVMGAESYRDIVAAETYGYGRGL